VTRLRTAVTAFATAAAVLAPAAHAEETPFGPVLRTSAAFGPWSLDAACHFGPTDSSGLETRMQVQGWATALGASRTTITCTVESGNGTWVDVYEAGTDGPVSVTQGSQHLWWSTYDRICVSARAEFVFMDHLVAPTVCQSG